MSGLRYIGTDRRTDWLPGVPARDLTAAEAKVYPQAASSQFYVPDDGKPAPKKVRKVASKVADKPTEAEASPAGPGEEEQEN